MNDIHETSSVFLHEGLKTDPAYAEQYGRILAGNECLLGPPSFLGFQGTYHSLSQLVPTDRVIYDLGCAWGLQAWFFRHHRKYIGVDLLCKIGDRLRTPNGEHHHISIEDFLTKTDIDPVHFAVCNFVPPWSGDNGRLVRERFTDLYVFYPRQPTNAARVRLLSARRRAG